MEWQHKSGGGADFRPFTENKLVNMVARDGIVQHYTPFGIPANGILLNPKSDLTTSVAIC